MFGPGTTSMKSQHNHITLYLCALIVALLLPDPAFAYIGPGAGFAFLGSAFVFLITIALALMTLLLWPFQLILRKIRGHGISKRAKYRRVVIVGLDGLEPSLVDQYMALGKLPNLAALKEQGSYSRLGTTLPALSPVAWSTFQTGVNPGAHNIFDFLTRDKRNYFPVLSSTETSQRIRRLGLGKFSLRYVKPQIVISRKSQPFWKVLGKHGIFSNVIRVPISYPPEKFYGNVLSAMCTPDLKGTQGSFTFYSTDEARVGQQQTGGSALLFEGTGDILRGRLEGPPKLKGEGYVSVPFALELIKERTQAALRIDGQVITLLPNQFSAWIEVSFNLTKRKKVSGIVRFCMRDLGAHVSLYISPVNVHPEKPALPIARPIYFASWLARKLGLFGTLGLMEDTWGRNELALDDRRFLDQAYLTHAERERMFMEVLDRTHQGVCVCVFDASDRIQHMFWRYLDDAHPSPREEVADLQNTIPEMYQQMDGLVGRVRAKLNPDDLLIVLSDHGFASFRRGVNLNTWLAKEGLLTLKNGKSSGADYLKDVDWSKTKAFALGLSGIYVNRKGRERHGIVETKEAEALKLQIVTKLESLKDPANSAQAVSKVYDTAKNYRGLYSSEAPDLVVGYNPGYRVSWDSVTGTVESEIFTDNLKAWSGDHHVDPKKIPGILFSSAKTKKESPHIVDIAPTVLNVFGVKIPAYMEGSVIL